VTIDSRYAPWKEKKKMPDEAIGIGYLTDLFYQHSDTFCAMDRSGISNLCFFNYARLDRNNASSEKEQDLS
jgi:hypothetical protein